MFTQFKFVVQKVETAQTMAPEQMSKNEPTRNVDPAEELNTNGLHWIVVHCVPGESKLWYTNKKMIHVVDF